MFILPHCQGTKAKVISNTINGSPGDLSKVDVTDLRNEPIEPEHEASEHQKSYSNVKVSPQVQSLGKHLVTGEIDVWSCGVILLCFLSKRFPFFDSADDVDALIELTSIFSRPRMRACARLHSSTTFMQ